jgi:hypothetical protein
MSSRGVNGRFEKKEATALEVELRFWDKVDIGDSCWLWTGSLNHSGYGLFRFRGQSRVASRVSWILSNGEIPKGIFVCHKCDNPRCVRPSHLFLGTHRENIDDMMLKGRAQKARGETASSSKFSNEQTEEIRNMYKSSGLTMRALGKLFSVNSGTICRMINRETYR